MHTKISLAHITLFYIANMFSESSDLPHHSLKLNLFSHEWFLYQCIGGTFLNMSLSFVSFFYQKRSLTLLSEAVLLRIH